MISSDQPNKVNNPKGDNPDNKTSLTGAAWVDKPVKVDGMTAAEEFTNTRSETQSNSD